MRILILEDSPERQEKFYDALDGNTSLYFATNAWDAITLLDSVLFDLAFLDHDLGEVDFLRETDNTGYTVAKWLQAHPDRMPKRVIIHSLNPVGAQRMAQCLPKAELLPAAWDYL